MEIKPGNSGVAATTGASQEIAADPSQPTTIIDQYLAAPPAVKSQARKAIGASNDDEAVQMIQSDGAVATMVRNILEQGQSVLTSGAGETPIEDVMYPPSA